MKITAIDVLLPVVIVVAFAVLRRQDLRRAVYLLFGLVFAGLITMNYFERVADALSRQFAIPEAYLPGAVYVLIFMATCWTLGRLVDCCPESAPSAWIAGCLSCGLSLASAVLSSAILLCALYTLPMSLERFGFAAKAEQRGVVLQGLPVDRLWLDYVQYASCNVFTVRRSQQFRVESDPAGIPARRPFTQRFAPPPPESTPDNS